MGQAACHLMDEPNLYFAIPAKHFVIPAKGAAGNSDSMLSARVAACARLGGGCGIRAGLAERRTRPQSGQRAGALADAPLRPGLDHFRIDDGAGNRQGRAVGQTGVVSELDRSRCHRAVDQSQQLSYPGPGSIAGAMSSANRTTGIPIEPGPYTTAAGPDRAWPMSAISSCIRCNDICRSHNRSRPGGAECRSG